MRKTILFVILIGVAVYAAAFFAQAKGQGNELVAIKSADQKNESEKYPNLVKVSVPLKERQAELKIRLQAYSAKIKIAGDDYKQALKIAIAKRDQNVAQALILRNNNLAEDGSQSASVKQSVLTTYSQAVQSADQNYAITKSVVESKYREALKGVGPEPKLSDIPREKVVSVSIN